MEPATACDLSNSSGSRRQCVAWTALTPLELEGEFQQALASLACLQTCFRSGSKVEHHGHATDLVLGCWRLQVHGMSRPWCLLNDITASSIRSFAACVNIPFSYRWKALAPPPLPLPPYNIRWFLHKKTLGRQVREETEQVETTNMVQRCNARTSLSLRTTVPDPRLGLPFSWQTCEFTLVGTHSCGVPVLFLDPMLARSQDGQIPGSACLQPRCVLGVRLSYSKKVFWDPVRNIGWVDGIFFETAPAPVPLGRCLV